MPIIHTALHSEAKIFKEEFSLRKVRSFRKIEIFARDNIVLVVSGVGKIPTSIGVSLASELYPKAQDLYLNLGIAGSARKDISLGEIRMLNKVVDLSSNRSYFPDCLIESELESSSLGTSDIPVVHLITNESKSYLTLNSSIKQNYPHSNPSLELYDMEASSFFQSAVYFTQSHKIQSLKIVSDYLEGRFCKATDVEEWMDAKKDTIFSFIECQRNFFLEHDSNSCIEKEKHNSHSKSTFPQGSENAQKDEKESIIKQIQANLRLTVAQMVEIKKAYEHWYFHTIRDDGGWKKFLYSPSDKINKVEGKQRMKALISYFYHRKIP